MFANFVSMYVLENWNARQGLVIYGAATFGWYASLKLKRTIIYYYYTIPETLKEYLKIR